MGYLERLQSSVTTYIFGSEESSNPYRKLGASSSYYSLINSDNIVYMLDLYMGTSSQLVSVAFDTGSDWLVLTSAECQCTDGLMYDTTSSTAYTRTSNTKHTIYYGDGQISGYYATDHVYLDSNG